MRRDPVNAARSDFFHSRSLAVTYRPVDSLVPDPRNARTHPKRQVDQIVASIREFGFTNPILIDADGSDHCRAWPACWRQRKSGSPRCRPSHCRGLTRCAEARAPACRQQDRARRRLGPRPAEARAWRALGARRRSRPGADRLLHRRDRRDPEGTGRSRRRGHPGRAGDPRTQARRHLDRWASTASAAATDAISASCKAVVGDGAMIDAAFLDPPYNVRINGHANAKGRHREFAMASGEMSDDGVPRLPRRDARRLRGGLARRRGPLRLHGLAAHGRRRGGRRPASTAICSTSASGTSPMPAWARSTARSTSWSSSTGSASAPHFNAVELGRHGRNRTNVWDYASVNSHGRQPARGPGAASDGQAHGAGRRRHPGRHAPGRTGARHLPRLGHDADRRRAHRAASSAASISIRPMSMSRSTAGSAMTGKEPRLVRGERHASRKVGPGNPPVSDRFRKGEVGNPEGRPKKQREETLRIGFRRGHRQDADRDAGRPATRGHRRRGPAASDLSGRACGQPAGPARDPEDDRQAREVPREPAKARSHIRVRNARSNYDPTNADEALLLLGIACHDPAFDDAGPDITARLLLEPWAVQSALAAARRWKPADRQGNLRDRRAAHASPETLRWPRGTADDR